MIRGNVVILKEIFLNIICKSSYPHISWLDFADFCVNVTTTIFGSDAFNSLTSLIRTAQFPR